MARHPWVRGFGISHLVLDEVRAGAPPAREPAARDRLLSRVELDSVRAVSVQVAKERVLPARERKERHGGRDADVDADHAGLGLVAEAPHRGTGLGEDRDAVAEPRAGDHLEGLVETARLD